MTTSTPQHESAARGAHGGTPHSTAASADAALRLLQFEADVRKVRSEDALLAHLANETRGLVPYDLAVVWRRGGTVHGWRPTAVSGLPNVDPNTPLLDALGRLVSTMPAHDSVVSLDPQAPTDIAALHASQRDVLRSLPLGHLLWMPLTDLDERVDAGMLLLKETAFGAGAAVLLGRIGPLYGHAWTALAGRKRRTLPTPRRRVVLALLAAGAVILGALPVRLSVMAPVEVVAARPEVMTAPISGVVKRIEVAPGSLVKAGDVLITFEDIQPRNEMLLAQQRLSVAQARNARVTAAAFQDPDAAHELANARAEYELARVTYDYTLEVLGRTTVRATSDGVAVYSDRRDWEGRAVQVGEEILQVANPGLVALRADLSTANSLSLQAGDRAEAFLDNAPLGGVPLRVRYATYIPRVMPGGDTAYTVMMDPQPGHAPRIGARGTVRLYGPRVALVVQLLRRPLAAFRQTVGI